MDFNDRTVGSASQAVGEVMTDPNIALGLFLSAVLLSACAGTAPQPALNCRVDASLAIPSPVDLFQDLDAKYLTESRALSRRINYYPDEAVPLADIVIDSSARERLQLSIPPAEPVVNALFCPNCKTLVVSTSPDRRFQLVLAWGSKTEQGLWLVSRDYAKRALASIPFAIRAQWPNSGAFVWLTWQQQETGLDAGLLNTDAGSGLIRMAYDSPLDGSRSLTILDPEREVFVVALDNGGGYSTSEFAEYALENGILVEKRRSRAAGNIVETTWHAASHSVLALAIGPAGASIQRLSDLTIVGQFTRAEMLRLNPSLDLGGTSYLSGGVVWVMSMAYRNGFFMYGGTVDTVSCAP